MTTKKSIGHLLLSGLGSFGLASLCFFTLFLLTVFGTLHQVEHGLYDAKKVFFSWGFAPIVLWGKTVAYIPGVASTLVVLTVNLTVGGIMRIRWQRRNIGVITIHFGIIFLLII